MLSRMHKAYVTTPASGTRPATRTRHAEDAGGDRRAWFAAAEAMVQSQLVTVLSDPAIRDERVGVREFDESVEFTYRLIKAMGVH
jgi:hypothetical protein